MTLEDAKPGDFDWETEELPDTSRTIHVAARCEVKCLGYSRAATEKIAGVGVSERYGEANPVTMGWSVSVICGVITTMGRKNAFWP
ncbi:hypothetical protein DM860_003841 [Cuscuta australis]|uniref:Uncharacterized protein n=1 Tax=Cuscuta australis TaxID=267555 RepID=A0A328CY17_9ASTE|nr:hypothetical protein DM860_003841 [Cuscuta australis]